MSSILCHLNDRMVDNSDMLVFEGIKCINIVCFENKTNAILKLIRNTALQATPVLYKRSCLEGRICGYGTYVGPRTAR